MLLACGSMNLGPVANTVILVVCGRWLSAPVFCIINLCLLCRAKNNAYARANFVVWMVILVAALALFGGGFGSGPIWGLLSAVVLIPLSAIAHFWYLWRTRQQAAQIRPPSGPAR